MRSTTQGFLVALLGAVLLRISITGEYLRFVTEWMRWPLVATGVLLLAMGIGPILSGGLGRGPADDDGPDEHDEHDHEHPVPRVTWLLALPVAVMFLIAPPALGAYTAERRATDGAPALESAPLTALRGESTRMTLGELLYRAQEKGGRTLRGQDLRLTGFVSYGDDGAWYLTRLTIGCCAADAAPYRVRVLGADPAPARDQWVAVVGRHVPGTGVRGGQPAAVQASDVRFVEEPLQPYE